MANKYNIPNTAIAKSSLEAKQNSPLDQLLIDLSNEVVRRLQKSLVKYDANTTSLGLSQSIRPDVNNIIHDSNGVQIGIEAEFYWKFINYGVNGTMISHGAPNWGKQPKQSVSFHQSILNWIPKRGLKLDGRDGGAKTYDELAWRVQAKIIREGKAPKPFFTEVMNSGIEKFMRPQIEKLLGESIKIVILAPWQSR